MYLCSPKLLSLNISRRDLGPAHNPLFPRTHCLKCCVNVELICHLSGLCLCVCLGVERVWDTLCILCFIHTLFATDIDNDF